MQAFDLNIARGPGTGKTIRLPGDRVFAIGRSQSNDLTLDDPQVSSHHARIQVQGGYFVLTDLNSKNHAYVNGHQITGAVILRDRDQIGLGDCLLIVREVASLAVTLSETQGPPPVRASIETAHTMAADLSTIKTAMTTLGRSEKTLAVLHAASKLLLESQEPAVFLPRLLDLMFEVVPADRGVVFLLEHGQLQPLHARDATGQALTNLSISRSVIQHSVDQGVAVLIGNLLEGGDYAQQESIVLHQIASAMCAPIHGRSNVLGAMYLDSKITGKAFEHGDLELLTTVATHAGIAHDNHRLASESARAERMAAIGMVVAGIAHDVRNYMLGVSLGQDVVDMEIQEKFSSAGKRLWESMKDSQKRIADLVQDMLAYSKPREPDWQLVDANQIAAAAVRALERRADGRGVLLELEQVPELAPVWCDPTGIERCLLNLVANGIDATQEGGTVTVRVARGGADGAGGLASGRTTEPGPEAAAPAEGTQTVEFCVADTGAGIPPDARGQVFDLFFSSKKSKGTGLGLALSRKIVEEHGGTITFTTEVDEGTTFTIALPMRDERPEST